MQGACSLPSLGLAPQLSRNHLSVGLLKTQPAWGSAVGCELPACCHPLENCRAVSGRQDNDDAFTAGLGVQPDTASFRQAQLPTRSQFSRAPLAVALPVSLHLTCHLTGFSWKQPFANRGIFMFFIHLGQKTPFCDRTGPLIRAGDPHAVPSKRFALSTCCVLFWIHTWGCS